MIGGLLGAMLARSSSPADPWIVALIFGAVIAIALAVWLAERARRRAIFESLRSRGYDVREKERPLDAVEDAPLVGNPLLLFKRNAVRWSATGEHKGNVVRLHEYQFRTGYGRSQQTHVFLFASAELPVALPDFAIERKRWMMSHRPAIKGEPPPVADPRVAEEFTCYSLDPAGAAAVLTPGVCDEIATWDKKYLLRCGGGWVSIGRRGSVKIAEIDDLLEKLDRVFGEIVAGLSSP